jgi:hypothetical protein
LRRLSSAEEARLKRELAELERLFNTQKAAIENMTAEELLELSKQTDWLEQIFGAVTDGRNDSTDPLMKQFDRDASQDIFNSMPGKTTSSQRGVLWQGIQDTVSLDGRIELDFPELGFTNAYDKVDKLLFHWKDQGLLTSAVIESLRTLLAPYSIGFGAIGTIPGFAAGGIHAGGLRLVGESGPEVEYTGPSYIAPNHSLPEIFSTANAEMAQELRTMRQELAESKRIQAEQAKAMQDLLKLHNRWNGEGMPADRDDYLKTMAEAEA